MLISNGKYPCSILELLIESPLNLEADVENRWFRRMKIQVEAADVQLLHQHSPYRRVSTGQGGTRATQDSICAWHQNLSSEKAKQKNSEISWPLKRSNETLLPLGTMISDHSAQDPRDRVGDILKKMLKASELITESHCYVLSSCLTLAKFGKFQPWSISGWWFQQSWKIWDNGKDYPVYCGI